MTAVSSIKSFNERACQGIKSEGGRNYRKSKKKIDRRNRFLKKKEKKRRIYVRSIPLCECLCSEFSLAQQKRTKEGLGPVLAGQRGSAHRTDMKISGFIRQTQRNTTGRRQRRRRELDTRHVHWHHRWSSTEHNCNLDAGRKKTS